MLRTYIQLLKGQVAPLFEPCDIVIIKLKDFIQLI